MLSSQINFYVLPEDLLGIQQWLEERDIVCVKTYSFDANPIIAKLNAELLNYGQVYLTLPKWIELFEYKSQAFGAGQDAPSCQAAEYGCIHAPVVRFLQGLCFDQSDSV